MGENEAAAGHVLETLRDAYVCIDARWRISYVNASAERLWDRKRADLLGRDMLQVFPQLAGSKKYRLLAEALRTGERTRFETLSLVASTPIEFDVYPAAHGLAIFMRDVRERWRLQRELSDRDALLRMAEQSAGLGIWDIDLPTDTVLGTEQFFRIMGLAPTDKPVPMHILRGLRPDDDRERVNEGYRHAVDSAQDVYDSEYRIRRPDGAVRVIFGRGRVVRDANGVPVRYSGIDIDITERKAMEEQRELLLAELQHRIMNTFGVISAIASKTLRTVAPEEVATFSARISALGRGYEALAARNWSSAELSSVVEKAIAPHRLDAKQFHVSGPSVQVTDRQALALSLALNELATNAHKYGALSVHGGQIAVRWRVVRRGSEQRLDFRWSERGGPQVHPPSRARFGRKLIEQYLADAFGGRVRLKFPPDGVVCILSATTDGENCEVVPVPAKMPHSIPVRTP